MKDEISKMHEEKEAIKTISCVGELLDELEGIG